MAEQPSLFPELDHETVGESPSVFATHPLPVTGDRVLTEEAGRQAYLASRGGRYIEGRLATGERDHVVPPSPPIIDGDNGLPLDQHKLAS